MFLPFWYNILHFFYCDMLLNNKTINKTFDVHWELGKLDCFVRYITSINKTDIYFKTNAFIAANDFM